MSVEVIATRRFQMEVNEQKRFIEHDRPGYGAKFVAKVEEAILHIKSHPGAWPPLTRSTRRICLDPFKNHFIRYRFVKNKNGSSPKSVGGRAAKGTPMYLGPCPKPRWGNPRPRRLKKKKCPRFLFAVKKF